MMTVVMILMSLNLAYADDNEVEPKVVYKKETTIDFEGLDIEGQLIKPQGAVIQERKTAAFNPLIRLRTDFNVEMSASVNDIK